MRGTVTLYHCWRHDKQICVKVPWHWSVKRAWHPKGLKSHVLKCLWKSQAFVSFKKYMPPPLPYFKVNIYPFPLPHFASIFFAYLWSFRWPNYIVTLPRYFSFRLPHLNIPTGAPSDELDKNIQRTWLGLQAHQWYVSYCRYNAINTVFYRQIKRQWQGSYCLYNTTNIRLLWIVAIYFITKNISHDLWKSINFLFVPNF
jgi:hypothetical protein